jgi:dinuclear metal center YbgI/SA1388 family protein
MKLAEIIAAFESFAPLYCQESYDNTGLAFGHTDSEITAALLCIDVTEAVLEEAIAAGANLVISHHPVIFPNLKRLTGSSHAERVLLKAIRNNIALYSAHTNLDNVFEGVNQKICQKLGLHNTRVLSPAQHMLRKLVTFVPQSHADKVRTALFNAGAGHIGKYDSCSFNMAGKGSFRASANAKPFTGEIGKLHFEEETRIETIFPVFLRSTLIDALMEVHPYEEVAYDIFPLDNEYAFSGAGMIGELKDRAATMDFLKQVKEAFGCQVLRYTPVTCDTVQKIAVCGGSGSMLIPRAVSAGADLFITGDIRYHQFFETEGRLILVDIGHYESERFTIEIFYEILKKKLPNFAVHFSSINTSPINYL